MSVPKPVLAREARDDVRDILRLSLQEWGQRQRDAYDQQLTDALDQLALFPELGRRHDDISGGLRSFRAGQHIIYYRLVEKQVTVLRLLHSRMDAAAHFSEEPSEAER